MINQQNADNANTLQLRDVATTTTFWLPMGYNFGCRPMTASNSAFTDCATDVIAWCAAKRLQLNTDKSEVM